MECPYCRKEMVEGSISQDRYALKWVSNKNDKGLLNFTPVVKGVKLSGGLGKMSIKVFYCEKCEKFIIDQNNL